MIKSVLIRALDALRNYRADPDPQAALANTVALVIVGNQPFYPLYLHAIVGRAAWPAWITLVTLPLFAIIPAVARRNALIGRAMLPIIGTANSILATKLIGVDTGVELFLLPCVLLAAMLFRERALGHARRSGGSVCCLFLPGSRARCTACDLQH